MSHAPTVSDVLGKLAALGSPRQIADFLADEDVAGFKGMAGMCPAANYIRRETGVRVLVGAALVFSPDTHKPCERIDDTAIREFVLAFDDGAYPELIDGYQEEERA